MVGGPASPPRCPGVHGRRPTGSVGSRRGATSSRTPVFEGPVDLLLHLVTTHEVDILEVPLAPVVDAFVAHLAEHRDQLSIDALSEFLLVAAILVELKSQRLLPGPDDVDDDEELVGWEERDLLLARLLECRAYAAAADAFARPVRGGRPLACPASVGPRRGLRGPRARTCWPGSPPTELAAGLPAGHRRAARPRGRPRPTSPSTP